MKTTTANSYRITQFKKELWVDMSNSCDPTFWSYSVSEKRLFLILTVLLVSLSLFYFNSYRNEDKFVREQVEMYASSNAASLKRLQLTATEKERSVVPTLTDEVKNNTTIVPTTLPQKNNKNDITNDVKDTKSTNEQAPSPTAVPSHQPTPKTKPNSIKKANSTISNVLADVTSPLLDTGSTIQEETALNGNPAPEELVSDLVQEKILQLP